MSANSRFNADRLSECGQFSAVALSLVTGTGSDPARCSRSRSRRVVWKDAPPTLPAGAKIAVLEGDPKHEGMFTIRGQNAGRARRSRRTLIRSPSGSRSSGARRASASATSSTPRKPRASRPAASTSIRRKCTTSSTSRAPRSCRSPGRGRGNCTTQRVIDVLYEDDVLLFVNKPPRLVVQRGYDPDEPTCSSSPPRTPASRCTCSSASTAARAA